MKHFRLAAHRFDMRFRTVFRHASARRARTENVIISATATSGETGYGEACPRAYVTGETRETVLRFFGRHRASLEHDVTDFDSLLRWRDAHAAEIDANPAAYAGVELAMLDAIGRQHGQPIEAVLGLPPLDGAFRYSAVLGDNPWLVYRLQLMRYRRSGFCDFKLKLSGNRTRDRAKLAPFRRSVGRFRVRADANNLWPDAQSCVDDLGPLDFPWFAIEEPVTAHRLDESSRVASALRTRIVLDESFLGIGQLDQLGRDSGLWILNCRVSKLGGLTRGLDIIREARRLGLGIIVGAHVGETSILTRAGLVLAAAAGDALVAQEGAFGTHLLSADLVEQPLMFGHGGVLRVEDVLTPSASGLGLDVDHSKLMALTGTAA